MTVTAVRIADVKFRLGYAALLVATVAAGLAVHPYGAGLPTRVQDVLGDALWAAMIFWILSLAAPRARVRMRALAALAVCFGVELSQLLKGPTLDAVRSSTIGHLVLGSDFDARDFVAYTAGVVAAVVLSSAVIGIRARHQP